MNMKVNLACGNVFAVSKDWVNFDFSPVSRSVRQANLLDRLPLADDAAEVVYSSHFLEHIPREDVPQFLEECRRILKPGGTIRLVTPDLENICRAYLKARESGEDEKADLVLLELLDQCVRRRSGGLLGSELSRLRELKGTSHFMCDFALHRFGPEMLMSTPKHSNRGLDLSRGKKSSLLQRFRRRFQRVFIRLWTLGLPGAFRAQNLSFAMVGELHHWLWDFHQLRNELESAGFIKAGRCDHQTSGIEDFPFDTLDRDPIGGGPRKGSQSMFVEARVP